MVALFAARPTAGSRRLRREARTVEVMIRMHCAARHGAGPRHGRRSVKGPPLRGRPSLCPECAALLVYSLGRIDACRFGAAKPVCAACPVHCFRPMMREGVREAMRFSGPRMSYRHPYLAVRHLLDRRNQPGATG
jgi:hypothetical protein